MAIRTTHEAPFFHLWRDAELIRDLARPELLTVARCEPIFRRQLGTSHIDLLFETSASSCIVGGLHIQGTGLLSRERPPVIWPAHFTAMLDLERLLAIEQKITPWLRSLARARPMASESIRRFARSDRFERARELGLLGAAPLEGTIVRMAPFVFARRFARDARVAIACADASLARAVLGDLAAAIVVPEPDSADDRFAQAWYGTYPALPSFSGTPDVLIAAERGEARAPIVIETSPGPESSAAVVDVPLPAPWDLLFSFDASDAPAAARFGVHALALPLREPVRSPAAKSIGGSAGTIVLAVSGEAFASHGVDMGELELLGERLEAEGFTVFITSRSNEPQLAGAALIHIIGAPFEEHMIEFAEFAVQRGIEFVFDLCPKPADSSAFLENSLVSLYRAALDDADIRKYVGAYETSRLDPHGVPEVSSDHHPRIVARFGELARRAAAILAIPEDIEYVRSIVPPPIADRVLPRGAFVRDEPAPGAVGHLVPRMPFALAYGPIANRSHAFYPALAAERFGIPFVIAGPVYDANYLQVIHANAPNTIVLADLERPAVSALYRAATVVVDAAPRPRSIAALVRTVACGALPVVAKDAPLARVAAGLAPAFSLKSIDDCGRTIEAAMTLSDRAERIAALQARLLVRSEPATALGSVIAAYSRVAAPV